MGAHLTSPIRGELGYAHRPQLGSQIHCPIYWYQIWGPLPYYGKKIFALTVNKFVFSHSGNFRPRTKANPPKPRSCPKCPSGQLMGAYTSSADWVGLQSY